MVTADRAIAFVNLLFAISATLFASGTGVAQTNSEQPAPYRLVSGDIVEVTISDAAAPLRTAVDIDGNLRLHHLGSVAVAGLTLDEAENKIETELAIAQIYNDPQASIAVTSYAPVIVAGDVRSPGRIEFVPGLTVTAALGIAGGTSATGVDRFDIEQARIENGARLRQSNFVVAEHVVRIIRLQAMIDQLPAVPTDSNLLSLIPAVQDLDLERMLRDQVNVFEAERTRNAELSSLWDDEVAIAAQQVALFEDRIALQRVLVDRSNEELSKMLGLEQQGITTAARVLTAQTRATDAENRLLELEAARVNAAQVLAEARRAKATFDARLSKDLLTQVSEERIALDAALLAYARNVDMQELLFGGVATGLLAGELTTIEYRRTNVQLDASDSETIGPDTRLRPGDTLVVTVSVKPLSQDDS